MSGNLTPRQKILNTTAQLLEMQGYNATGLNQIVAQSGAPKGSLYHYFPDGKEEIAVETIEAIAQGTADWIKDILAQTDDPAEAFKNLLYQTAGQMEAHDCGTGGSVAAVTLEMSGSSEKLRQVCLRAYELRIQLFEEKLTANGYAPEQAARLAMLIESAAEGAMIISRARQNSLPLEQIGDEISTLLKLTAPKE